MSVHGEVLDAAAVRLEVLQAGQWRHPNGDDDDNDPRPGIAIGDPDNHLIIAGNPADILAALLSEAAAYGITPTQEPAQSRPAQGNANEGEMK